MSAGQSSGSPADELTDVRAEIERIDGAIVRLIGERLRAGERVAAAKRAARLPLLDPEQEAAVIRRAAELARNAKLPEEDIRDLFWRIIALTRQSQVSPS